MSKADPPTPPDPTATAGAQTSSNVSTAIANAFLNNQNQRTPLGGLTYDVTDTFQWRDPSTGSTYSIPRFTATQNLNPTQAQTLDQTELAKLNLANLSNAQSSRLYGALSSPFDPSGAPAAADPNLFLSNPPIQSNFADVGNPWAYFDEVGGQGARESTPAFEFGYAGAPQNYFGDVGDVTRGFNNNLKITSDYGPADNFSADRARVEEALYGRLNPQLSLEQQHIEQQLADQGIRYGSPAYTAAMDSYNRQANDARLAVTQTAGQEQERLVNMARARAVFQNTAQAQDYAQELQRFQAMNSAQQQAYLQALGRGEFANKAQEQLYQQMLGRGEFRNKAADAMFAQAATRAQFANAAQQQAFTQAQARPAFSNAAVQQQLQLEQAYNTAINARRAAYLQEQYAQRAQPINETSALISGSQVQLPSFITPQPQQIPTTDVAGLMNANFNQQFQNFQAQQNQQNQIIGGLFGLGSGALIGSRLSDRRAKKNIHRVGTVFASTKHAVAGLDGAGNDNVKELPIYRYAYKGDPTSTAHVGPMAQDVEQIDPTAVREIGGRKHIDTRTMGAILRAAA